MVGRGKYGTAAVFQENLPNLAGASDNRIVAVEAAPAIRYQKKGCRMITLFYKIKGDRNSV